MTEQTRAREFEWRTSHGWYDCKRYNGHELDEMLAAYTAKLRAHISTLESELQKVKVERDGLREACERIERWFGEFPQVPEKGHMVSYVVAYGSNGERDFMRSIAKAALAPAPAARTEEKC